MYTVQFVLKVLLDYVKAVAPGCRHCGCGRIAHADRCEELSTDDERAAGCGYCNDA